MSNLWAVKMSDGTTKYAQANTGPRAKAKIRDLSVTDDPPVRLSASQALAVGRSKVDVLIVDDEPLETTEQTDLFINTSENEE